MVAAAGGRLGVASQMARRLSQRVDSMREGSSCQVPWGVADPAEWLQTIVKLTPYAVLVSFSRAGRGGPAEPGP